MTGRASFTVAAALALALFCAAAAQAAESVLTIIPSDALAVVVVKNLAEADAKIQKLAALVQAPTPSPLGFIKLQFGITKGVDEKGTLAVIALPSSSGKEPDGLFVIPVTDYKEFIAQFKGTNADEKITEIEVAGEKGFAAHRGGYALLGFQAEGRARNSMEKILDAKQSIAAELAGIEPWLAENDVALGTRAGIRWAAAKGQEELKKTDKEMADMADRMGDEMAANMANMRTAFDFYGKALALADKEVALAAVGVAIDAQCTVRVTSRVRFLKDSPLGQSLAAVKPAEQNLMAGLPGGSFVFALGAETPEVLTKQLAALGTAFMQKSYALYGLTPAQAEQLAKNSMHTLGQMRAISLVMKTGKRGEPIYSNIFAAIRVDDAPRYIEQCEKQMQAQNRILKEAKESVMKPIEVEKTQLGGRPGLKVEITIPLPKVAGDGPGLQMQQAMLQAMFGANSKMTSYLAAGNETTVVMGYGTSAEKVGEAIEMVRNAKPGLADDKDVAATAALGLQGAQCVAYVSPRGYINMMQRMMQEMAGIAGAQEGPGFTAPAIPAFPQTPPVGIALKATAGALDASIVVPAALLKAAGEYATTMRQPQIP